MENEGWLLCCLAYDVGKVQAGFDSIWAQRHHNCKLLLCRKEALHCSYSGAAVNQMGQQKDKSQVASLRRTIRTCCPRRSAEQRAPRAHCHSLQLRRSGR